MERFLRIVAEQPQRLALPPNADRGDSARIVDQIIASSGPLR